MKYICFFLESFFCWYFTWWQWYCFVKNVIVVGLNGRNSSESTELSSVTNLKINWDTQLILHFNCLQLAFLMCIILIPLFQPGITCKIVIYMWFPYLPNCVQQFANLSSASNWCKFLIMQLNVFHLAFSLAGNIIHFSIDTNLHLTVVLFNSKQKLH